MPVQPAPTEHDKHGKCLRKISAKPSEPVDHLTIRQVRVHHQRLLGNMRKVLRKDLSKQSCFAHAPVCTLFLQTTRHVCPWKISAEDFGKNPPNQSVTCPFASAS